MSNFNGIKPSPILFLHLFENIIKHIDNSCQYVVYKNGTVIINPSQIKLALPNTHLMQLSQQVFEHPSGNNIYYINYGQLSNGHLFDGISQNGKSLLTDLITDMFELSKPQCVWSIITSKNTYATTYISDLQKECMSHLEKDIESQEIIFDSSKEKWNDYEPVMYIFVNHDLSMGKGKIAGQVGHVCCHLTKRMINNPTQESVDWDTHASKKVVVKATMNQLNELEKMANSISIHDAGRTQIPANSLTVVGFMPMYEKNVPKTFKEYKLL